MKQVKYRVAFGSPVAIAIVALAGAFVALPGGATAAPRGSAVSPNVIELSSPAIRVSTPSGEHLDLLLSVTKSNVGTSAGQSNRFHTELSILLSTPDGTESHQWEVGLPNSALRRTADGYRLTSAQKMGKYATVRLAFTNVGDLKRQRCPFNHAPGHVTTQRGTLKGIFFFDSHSRGKHRWGKVGSLKERFSFPNHSTVLKSYGNATADCSRGPNDAPCFNGLNWFTASNHPGSDSLSGGYRVNRHGRKVGVIRGSRHVELPTTAIDRFDQVTLRQPPPTLAVNNHNAKLDVNGRGAVTGSATLRSTTPASPRQVPCAHGRQKSTQSLTQWHSVTYRNGAHPLRVGAEVFGAFSAPDAGSTSMLPFIDRAEP